MHSDQMSIDEKFERLKDALRRDNEKDILEAIWSLDAGASEENSFPEVIDRLLTLLAHKEAS